MRAQDIRRTLQREFVRTLRRPFMDAVQEYGLVQAGDRVAVCISGGKDSMLLALLMQDLQRTVDCTLVFLAMDPGYTPAGRAQLEDNARQLGLPLEVFGTDVLRVAGNHAAEHPCFLCAKMRRGHLYAAAQARGCNKIALGHHYDDAIETVLMGLLYGGQVQAMLPPNLPRRPRCRSKRWRVSNRSCAGSSPARCRSARSVRRRMRPSRLR